MPVIQLDGYIRYIRLNEKLIKQLVMRTRSLHKGYIVRSPPDEQPITSIANMAFSASSPFARKGVHAMTSLQSLETSRRVFNDEIDNIRKARSVDMLFLETLDIPCERRRELRF